MGKNVLCGYSMWSTWALGHVKNKHSFYRGEGCNNIFCSSWRENAKNVVLKRKKCYPILPNLVDNLAEGIQKTKDCNCFLNMKVTMKI